MSASTKGPKGVKKGWALKNAAADVEEIEYFETKRAAQAARRRKEVWTFRDGVLISLRLVGKNSGVVLTTTHPKRYAIGEKVYVWHAHTSRTAALNEEIKGVRACIKRARREASRETDRERRLIASLRFGSSL